MVLFFSHTIGIEKRGCTPDVTSLLIIRHFDSQTFQGLKRKGPLKVLLSLSNKKKKKRPAGQRNEFPMMPKYVD